MTRRFNWKIFLILIAASTFGLVAILPYSLALQGTPPAQLKLPMPLWLLITVQMGMQVLFFGVAVAIGLACANTLGLGLPILERALRGEQIKDGIRRVLPISILLGVASALLVIALDVLVFQPALKVHLGSMASHLLGPKGSPAPWKGFLASFYGGINEEILLRLGVMSLLAWLGRFIFLSSKASRIAPVCGADEQTASEGKPMFAVLWVANVLAAVLFGLGHLPATSLLVPLTPLVVLRAIVLNGLIGVACGYLYFKHGLESAILSHFSADIVLHVLFAI